MEDYDNQYSIFSGREERLLIMGNDVRRVDIGKFCLTNNGSGENYEI